MPSRPWGRAKTGPERLEQAVTAYNAALEVRTREQVPLDWANTQDNLGDALVFLGNRESRTGSLELAANAYRAALEVFTPEHMNWATTQRKLMLVEETIENLLTNPTTSERGIAALLVRRSPLLESSATRRRSTDFTTRPTASRNTKLEPSTSW